MICQGFTTLDQFFYPICYFHNHSSSSNPSKSPPHALIILTLPAAMFQDSEISARYENFQKHEKKYYLLGISAVGHRLIVIVFENDMAK